MAIEDMVINVNLVHDLDSTFCEGCIMGKQHRNLFPANQIRRRGNTIGELVHTNLVGHFYVLSMGNSMYFILFKDDYSTFCVIFTIKYKFEALECFKHNAIIKGSNKKVGSHSPF